MCENLSDHIPSIGFILLAHNLHVSELAWSENVICLDFLPNIELLASHKN